MPDYKAPLRDMRFVLNEVLDLDGHYASLGLEDINSELLNAFLEEGAKFSENELAPLNRSGDEEGCGFDNGVVTTPKGFKEAYSKYVEGGWPAMGGDPEFGGQGLPGSSSIAISEMTGTANWSWSMYPGLSHGAVATIEAHGTDEQKQTYLPKLTSGEWTGTMCLTEAHCGSDLGLLKTKAEPQADGSYKITGTKIFISAGEHDMADNIVHIVLARLPDAPKGTKGISLFIVPKFLTDGNGSVGERNAVTCGSIEHKMGIKASATCVMNFDGAKGYLIGPENKGLNCMFTFMNTARIGTAIQGLGAAELGFQGSLAYAKERLAMRSLSGPKNPDGIADPIIVHPDVRRMLMRQKVLNEGMRALALFAGHQLDLSVAHPDETVRESADDLVQLLTPVVKSFLTDEGFNNANTGLQVLGGSGFTTDWPLEQLVRDGRIARIYEGTNGIQAMDLVGRKLSLKGGQLVRTLFGTLSGYLKDNPEAPHREELKNAMKALETATMWLASNAPKDPEQAGAAATPYLRLMALTVIGYLWSRMANVANEQLAAGEGNKPLLESKVVSARFYFERLLPEVDWLLGDIQSGKDSLMAFSDDHWAA